MGARRVDRLQSAQEEFKKLYPGVRFEYRQLDVTNLQQIRDVTFDIEKTLGGLDVVVANSGVLVGGPVGEGKIEDIKKSIDVNITGAFVTVDTAVEVFRRNKKGGHIVGISSVVAFRGTPGLSVYSATKAALNLYLQVVQEETKGDNISVTTISPGLTDTEMTSAFKRPHMITAEESARQIYEHVANKSSHAIIPLL